MESFSMGETMKSISTILKLCNSLLTHCKHQRMHQKVLGLCKMVSDHTVLLHCFISLRNTSVTESLLSVIPNLQASAWIDLHISRNSILATSFSGRLNDTVYSKKPQTLEQFGQFICEAYESISVDFVEGGFKISSSFVSCYCYRQCSFQSMVM